jgi:hypothetical protein
MPHLEEDPLRTAARLRAGADELLRSTGLLSLVGHYGQTCATGSYAYDLMTWRDIDLCVATEDLSVGTMFRLGAALAALPHVGSMYYRNEFVMQTQGNPLAVFWCVDFYLPEQEKWKVDLLFAGAEEVGRVLLPGRQLQERLTPEAREAILHIKAVLCRRPAYRQEYGSQAVYRAVTEGNVRTVEEWEAWWAAERS